MYIAKFSEKDQMERFCNTSLPDRKEGIVWTVKLRTA